MLKKVQKKVLFFFIFLFIFCCCQDKYSKYGIPSNPNQINEISFFINVDELLDKYPDSEDLQIQKLRILQQRNWSDNEDDFIENILTKNDYNQLIYELIVKYYLAKSQIKKAFEVIEKAEYHGANTVSFYELKSQLFNYIGEYTKSIDYINKAILLNKNNSKYYYNKGRIYLSLEDTLSGIKFMNAGLSQFKNDYEMIYEVSNLYMKIKRYQEAEKLIVKGISNAPDTDIEKLEITQAKIYIGQNKYQQAIKLLKKICLKNDYNTPSALMLSDLLMQTRQFDSAIYISNQILNRDSLNIYALQNKARSFSNKGFYRNSVVNYKLILAQDSLFENTKEEMEKVQAKRTYVRKLKKPKVTIPIFDAIVPRR